MSFGLYEAKRLLRRPQIWYGRYRHRHDSESDRRWFEHNGYRKDALEVAGAKAVDPSYFHRADLDASSTVVDVGAFQGEGSEDLFELYGCRIYSFEPCPTFFRDLEARFADNPRVTTVPVGLGAGDALLPMQVMGPGSTVHGEADADVATVDVPIRDVAAALDELGLERVDLMEINIEGAEYDLLERLVETGWIDRVRYLLIQFHEWYPHAHRRRRRIRRRLRATHDEVWNHPWIFELWCHRGLPHPPPPTYSDEELERIRAELRAQAAARAAQQDR
jgi:FkbM family methyltransferase